MTVAKKIFITGASKGLGYACCVMAAQRGLQVVGSVRNEKDLNLQERMQLEADSGTAPGAAAGRITLVVLDVEKIDAISPSTLEELHNCDILVNNAGYSADMGDETADEVSIFTLNQDTFAKAVRLHAEGPRKLMALAIPAMLERGWGRVINVSSQRAQLSHYNGDRAGPAYRLSKLLLNGITVAAAHAVEGKGVLINSVCPGWCRTDTGGPQATDSAQQGAQRILRLAFLEDAGTNGKFYINDEVASF